MLRRGLTEFTQNLHPARGPTLYSAEDLVGLKGALFLYLLHILVFVYGFYFLVYDANEMDIVKNK